MEIRKNFGSRAGAVLAAAGSAVGLGNVWRFPTEVGNNGGAAFILIYLICVLLVGVPVMLSEFVVGRHTHANTVTAFARLAPRSWWRFEGVLSVFAAFLILSYYVVISGWTLYYLVETLQGSLTHDQDFKAGFNAFVSHPWWPVVSACAFMGMTHLVIARGVQSGIERVSKILMPMLLVILVLLVICSFSMPGARDGLRFLLKPDFSKVTTRVMLSAMAQAFFSLSLAMGCLCTYASYFTDETRLVRTAVNVSMIDTMVAILSGFVIFPAEFSVPGVEADAGPGLVFITLPNVFHMASLQLPWVAYIFSVMFYLLLLLAALTSAISLHESVTAYVLETTRLSRRSASAVVSVLCMLVGVACSLSFGPWNGFRLFGMTIFEFLDFTASKIFLLFGGIIICLFVGWKLDRQLLLAEVTNRGTLRFRLFRLYVFLIRYVVPAFIAVVFVNELIR